MKKSKTKTFTKNITLTALAIFAIVGLVSILNMFIGIKDRKSEISFFDNGNIVKKFIVSDPSVGEKACFGYNKNTFCTEVFEKYPLKLFISSSKGELVTYTVKNSIVKVDITDGKVSVGYTTLPDGKVARIKGQ